MVLNLLLCFLVPSVFSLTGSIGSVYRENHSDVSGTDRANACSGYSRKKDIQQNVRHANVDVKCRSLLSTNNHH